MMTDGATNSTEDTDHFSSWVFIEVYHLSYPYHPGELYRFEF